MENATKISSENGNKAFLRNIDKYVRTTPRIILKYGNIQQS